MKYLAFILSFTLAFSFFGVSPVLAAAPSDYVSCWDLNETSGTRYDANTTNSNDLTDNNTVGYSTTSKAGNSADFIEANVETLSITDAASVGLEPAQYTFAIWVHLDNVNGGEYFGGKAAVSTHSSPYAAYSWMTGGDANRYFSIQGNEGPTTAYTAESNIAATASTWYHLVATYNGTTLKGYVNNVEKISVAKAATYYNDGVFRLGGHTTYPNLDYTMDGRMDVAEVYDRALSVAEIDALYNSGSGVSCTGRAVGEATPAHESIIYY